MSEEDFNMENNEPDMTENVPDESPTWVLGFMEKVSVMFSELSTQMTLFKSDLGHLADKVEEIQDSRVLGESLNNVTSRPAKKATKGPEIPDSVDEADIWPSLRRSAAEVPVTPAPVETPVRTVVGIPNSDYADFTRRKEREKEDLRYLARLNRRPIYLRLIFTARCNQLC
jgi:hypothetical protein